MSIDVEQAVLGACLCSEQAYWRVADILVPEDFSDGRLGRLYAMIRERARTESAFDAITIGDADPRFRDIAMDLASSDGWRQSNVRAYAELVVQNAQARRIQAAGHQITRLAGPDALSEAQRLIAACAPRHAGAVRHIREYLRDATGELQRRVDSGGAMTGTPTGTPALDELTDGLQRGDLIVLAARPSVGKTAKALQIAVTAARHKTPVLFFEMEMKGVQLTDRIQAHVAQVNATGLRRPSLLNDDDFRRLFQASVEINQLPIQIDQTPALTVEAISARARQVHATSGVGLIVIDYLGLITLPKANTTADALQIVTGSLKRLAMELNVPVLALSQLNREADGKRPTLAELRGGGSIEQDADVVMFLWRPREEKKNELVLLLEKQRNGETGEIPLDADYAHMRFIPVDRQAPVPKQSGFGGFGRKQPVQNFNEKD